MKTKALIIFLAVATALLLLVLFLNRGGEPPPAQKAAKQENLSQLIPGQTKREDIFKKTGEPSFVETRNGRTYFYYDTQNSSFRDVVVLQGGVEIYALENVFSEDSLSLESLIKSFGEYQTYYSETDPFLWYAFLTRGVALETDERDVLKVLYFIPQSEEEFLVLFGEELGIIKEPPTPEVLRP